MVARIPSDYIPPQTLPFSYTDEDGSVSFEEFTEYMAQLSLMESQTDSDCTEDDFPLPDTLTTPTLEVASVEC